VTILHSSDRWHLGLLDSLRGIAVLGVILVHSWIWGGHQQILHWPLEAVCASGQRGVQLFFVVSAFTLYLSHDNRRAENYPTRNFFIRRICRIVPMFYVAAVISYLFAPQWFGTIKEAWPSLILLHGISPQTIQYGPAGGWSVADEALFYLCLPLFFRWITDLRSALTAFCIAAPLCFLGAHFLVKAFPGQFEFIWFLGFPAEFPVFLIGIVGYFVWREWIKGRRDPLLSSALLAAAVLLYFSFIPFNYGTLYGTSFTALLL
jgi:peptidoglycan/LPS O-acetylase OafA/YrhL